MPCRCDRSPRLQKCDEESKGTEAEKSNPVTNRTTRNRLYWVALRFSSELISIPRNDYKILHIFPYDFAVASPEWGDRIKDDSQSIHAKFPDMLILISVALF